MPWVSTTTGYIGDWYTQSSVKYAGKPSVIRSPSSTTIADPEGAEDYPEVKVKDKRHETGDQRNQSSQKPSDKAKNGSEEYGEQPAMKNT